jgi:hypothetical protein
VFQSHYHGEDVVAEYFSFIGEGKYTVKKDTLTLNFYTNYKPRLLQDLNLDSRFIRPRYKIDDYPITGTLTFPISKFKDTIKLGALIKNK